MRYMNISTLFLMFLALCMLPSNDASAQQTISADTAHGMRDSSASPLIIDVRPSSDFQAAHIPGAINLTKSAILKAHLSKTKPLVLYCDSANCMASDAAAQTLASAGYTNVSVLVGGIAAWEAKSYPVVAAPATPPASPIKHVSAAELHSQLPSKSLTVVDVRPASDFRAGHIPGAINIPLETLAAAPTNQFSTKSIVVYDRIAQRAQQAAKQLQGNGFQAEELAGGISVWIAMKYQIQL